MTLTYFKVWSNYCIANLPIGGNTISKIHSVKSVNKHVWFLHGLRTILSQFLHATCVLLVLAPALCLLFGGVCVCQKWITGGIVVGLHVPCVLWLFVSVFWLVFGKEFVCQVWIMDDAVGTFYSLRVVKFAPPFHWQYHFKNSFYQICQ